ncbi:MAG: hypothetical protein AAF066_06060 [Pseudomonadota bacterium]
MHAVVREKFDERPKISNFPDPKLFPGAVMLKVEATGVYRSDWRLGHDTDITLPHGPGHKLAINVSQDM